MAPFGRPCRAYDCLLVRHCEYSSILYVLSYLTLNNIVTLKSGLELRSLKVIQTGTIQKFGCGFLFAFHSNYGSILYYIRDKPGYWSKFVIFSYPLVFDAPVRRVPIELLPFRLIWENYNYGFTRRWEKVWRYVYPFWQNVRTWQTHTHRQTDGHRMPAKAALDASIAQQTDQE